MIISVIRILGIFGLLTSLCCKFVYLTVRQRLMLNNDKYNKKTIWDTQNAYYVFFENILAALTQLSNIKSNLSMFLLSTDKNIVLMLI